MMNKRQSVPPARLTYTGLGQQGNMQLPGNMSAATEEFSLYNHHTIAELEDLISMDQQIVDKCNETLQRTTPIAEQFQHVDETTLTVEELDFWSKTMTDHHNAKICLKQASGRIRDATKVMTRKLGARTQDQPGLSHQISSVFGQGASLKSVSKASSLKSKSNSSSLTVRMRQAKIEAEKEVVALRHRTEEEIEACEDKIEKLQGAQCSNEDEKSRNEAEVARIQTHVDKLRRRTEAKVRRLQESANIKNMKLELELEEGQILSSDEELNAAERISDWVDSQKNEYLGFDHSPSQAAHYGGEPTVGFQNDSNIAYHPVPSRSRVQFNEPAVGYNYATHEDSAPQDWSQGRTEGQAFNLENQITGPLDKDSLMVQLLQTQLNILQRPSGKDWEPRDLPTFSGKAEDWSIFKNEFRRTTPEGKENSSQNAIRLRKALVGTARDTVIGLLNDPKNVQKIMEMLERRFGRSELIIEALIQKAECCKAPDINKPDTFVQFGIVVQQLVESLRSLEEATFLNDRTLQNKLISKLPVLYASEWLSWIDARPQDVNNLDSFGKWMEGKVDNLMRLTKPVITPVDHNSVKTTKRGSGIIATTAAEDTAKSERTCAYCGKSNHLISNCFQFKKQSVESRIKTVKENGLCFRCLEKGHSKRDCKSERTCTVKECGSTHHPLLHGGDNWKPKAKRKENPEPSPVRKEINRNGIQSGCGADVAREESTIGATVGTVSKPMSICRVRVKGPKGTRIVYCLQDSGSDSTVIDEELSTELGLTGDTFDHHCTGIGAIKLKQKARNVSFQISGMYPTAQFYNVEDATTMKVIGIPPYTQDVEEVKGKWPYLRKAKLESFHKVIPRIIIGEDNPFLSAHRNILERGDHEPMAKRTVLGWVLAGKLQNGNGKSAVHFLTDSRNEKLETLIKQSYTLESFGVVPSQASGSIEDQRALKLLEETVRKVDGVWECGLLWRDPNVKLPESRLEAVRRLVSNEKRMQRDKVLLDMYHAKMEEYQRKGYITEMGMEKIVIQDRTCYIPHFPHFNVNKPGKLRLVFDAASKMAGGSLNDHLVTGPDLIRPLPAVLWNFRRHNIVIQGDIEDMFHRVNIRKEDRDSQRFVFRNLLEKEPVIRDYWMNVLIFGLCSSPCSAIYVKNENAREFQKTYPVAVQAIIDDFYCDDCLSGAQTVEEAIILRRQIYEINRSGNFYVKKWHSNSLEVIESVPVEDRAIGVKQIDTRGEIPSERVLGMLWDPVEDCFTFSANFKKIKPEIMAGERPTKRELCSVLMSLFDPLGFIGNLKIKGMILLQRSWRSGIDWDDHVTDDIFTEWIMWLKNLKKTEGIRIPRCYCQDIHLASTVELHTMVDSSEEACAAICFLRVELGGHIAVSFVSAKVKVAPVKKLTIPRLELLAAVMGVSLAHTITTELKVPFFRRVFWCDSKTVLLWIRSETLRYKEFVANKISRIHELSNVSEWRWVPTRLNVADQGTRIKQEIQLDSDSEWLTGPQFLRFPCEKWPLEPKKEVIEEDLSEAKKSSICTLGDPFGVGVSTGETCGLKGGKNGFMQIERFSSFNRLVRAQATVNKAVKLWISKVRKEPWLAWIPYERSGDFPTQKKAETEGHYRARIASYVRESVKTVLCPEDLRQAEICLIRQVQESSFSEDYQSLKSGILNKSSRLRKLAPYMEDGIIRMRGRIGEASVPQEVKNPVILPGRHHFAELLIEREHVRNAHQGQSTVLNNLRQKYWVLEGKAAVKRVWRKCLLCKMKKVTPLMPTMGNLPSYRLSHGQPPFTFTGMDLFGPLEVTVGRHHEKRWVYLFTCMVTRAIHLEVVYGLSTDETMMALSRFIDQRGRPKFVYSDNGTNFVGAKRYLHESWNDVDWSEIRGAGKLQEIEWKFSPPCSPHFGGAWERMVQAVKKVLKEVLKEKFPKDQVLFTVIKGAENIVNSRPLSSLSDDPADPAPLTPNHFLRGFCDLGPSIPGEYEKSDEILRQQWRKAQLYLDIFWERWTREVLPHMAQRQKWHSSTSPLDVGDLVFLVDDQLPRNLWARGFISAVFPGKDGQVRVVEVTTHDVKSNRKVTYKRGVDKVCPLGLTIGKSE